MRNKIAPFVALSLLLAACGSGTKIADETSDPTDTTVPAETTVTTVAASDGCTAGTVTKPGEDEKVITSSSGVERYYFRHTPTGYLGTSPLPVVVDIHGYSEGSTVHLMMSKLGALGDTKGFITITPEGTGPVPHWLTAADSPDMAYIGDLLDEIEATLCVDRDRVFVTGLSNGAMMTSAIACVYSDRFAAYAPVAGVQVPEDCATTKPTPLITFHGTEDGFVGYDGGLGQDALDLPAPDGSEGDLGEVLPEDMMKGPTVPEAVAMWAKRNGCSSGVDTATESDINAEVTLIEHDCPAGAETVLYRINGGGHTWPGSEFSKAIIGVVGFTTMTISANNLMWDFFVGHPRMSL